MCINHENRDTAELIFYLIAIIELLVLETMFWSANKKAKNIVKASNTSNTYSIFTRMQLISCKVLLRIIQMNIFGVVVDLTLGESYFRHFEYDQWYIYFAFKNLLNLISINLFDILILLQICEWVVMLHIIND